jgi:hypothetical protein
MGREQWGYELGIAFWMSDVKLYRRLLVEELRAEWISIGCSVPWRNGFALLRVSWRGFEG